MVGAFGGLSPVVQALLATTFTWGMTAAGAALVFGTKNVPRKLLDSMLGFAAGVMIAASFWSLLAPAIELSEAGSLPVWVPPVIGFLAGGLFLRGLDGVLPHLHPGMKMSEAEGPHTTWRRSVLLVSAITLHNIPEGLAVGAGAILQVIYEVTRLLLRDSARSKTPALSAPNLGGLVAGVAIMYATALLVSV